MVYPFITKSTIMIYCKKITNKYNLNTMIFLISN